MLFIVYQLWVTGLFQARTQDRLRDELARSWSEESTDAPAEPLVERGGADPGALSSDATANGALAVLRIPEFGDGYAPVVVEGVTVEALELGPGHYPGTALPGEIGNFVVSGHRTTYGAPFSRLDELDAGDPVVVEARDRYFTYR
nr:sortase [Micromonospora sp. DSM 115978]